MTDTRPTQIKSNHLKRKAAVYNRVSTPRQAEESIGSITHQGDQQEYALRWGWRPDQIDLYLADLGVSASGGVPRPDWQRLLRDIANGEVGAVFSSDHSRLSRLAASFEALLAVCCANDTLLVIDGVIINPNDPNDRFIARIRANFAEFENAHRTEQMRKARFARAREGCPVSRPPVGYIAVQKGKGRHWIKDPNPQVRQRILDCFHRYEVLGSLRKVLMWLREHDFKLPSHDRGTGELQWKNPSHIAIYGILANPAYCGLYRYGRTESGPPGAKRKLRLVPKERWIVKPGLHPGYITMADWDRIQERLRNNRIMGNNQPGGSGNALCQGRVTCGACERRLQTRYPARSNDKSGRKKYVCWGASAQYGEPKCIQIDGDILDAIVAREVLRAFAPIEVETILLAAVDMNAGYAALQRQRADELERARSRAQILKAHVLQVDPSKRLAAAELTKDLDEALVQVQELDRRYRDQPLTPPLRPTPEAIEEILQLAADLPNLWADPATTNEDRRRLVRLVVRQIRVVSVSPTIWEVDIAWASGAVTRHALLRPWAWRPAALELATQGLTPDSIAEVLTIRGFKTRQGGPVSASLVQCLLHHPACKAQQAKQRRQRKQANA